MAAKSENKNFITWVRSNLSMLYLVIALFALRWTFIEPYVVPTGSMEPTLKTGDRLYALKCAYDVRFPFTETVLFQTGSVKRGDIFLFRNPSNPDITFVKRAVGLPGDRLEFRDGVLFVNGQEMLKTTFPNRKVMYDIEDEFNKTLYLENLTGVKHYVIHWNRYDHSRSRFHEEVTVPADHYFAVGDNRDNSYDSRSWGFVPKDNLKGKAMFIWYSSWDPALKESMTADYSLPMRVLAFFYEFFKFFVDWGKGEAWVRYERVGTFVQ